MNVNRIGHYDQSRPPSSPMLNNPSPEQSSFTQLLEDALSQLNQLQLEADAAATKIALGEPAELHQAMIAMEKATIAMQLALQVRNKMIEAYQEIMRTQM